MSSSETPYRGRLQAQGEDIKKDGGYSYPWAQNIPVTDEEGLLFLSKIELQCSESQHAQRKQAFAKAKRFINNASKEGGVGPESQPHSFQDSKRRIKDARVDIEISIGLTFVPSKKEK
jgi:hypothetical protein